jgi:hypothetical protein|tara:strand:+ start:303 stop:488 length:186 start_codon:yes stop_codon:yes gene_type:complete
MVGDRDKAKFYAKKRTRSGRYITIAEAATRQELIRKIKSDSETYEKERDNYGKETHRHGNI